MGFQDYQQSLKWMAQNSNKNNLMTGKIFIKRDNDRYDCIILGDQNIVMPNLLPANPREEYNIGDEVFIGLPWGSLSILRILMRSNTSIPTEKIFTFRTKPVVSLGTIYLACPDENTIKVYSLDGTPGIDIAPGRNSQYNIVFGIDYLYCASHYAYVMYKIKTDGTGEETIAQMSMYHYAYGLAIDNTEAYLYQTDGNSSCIARITISDGTIDDTWKDFNSGFEDVINATDLCGNSSYLFVVGNAYTGGGRAVIRIFDYFGNFIREIFIYSANIYKITADETNIYLYSVADEYFIDTTVEIYTITGTFVRRISENGIRAVAVKDGKLYIVTEENSGGGAT